MIRAGLVVYAIAVVVTSAALASAHTDNGTPGNNYLLGHNDHKDTLDGNAGDDTVDGRGVGDDVRGGTGQDLVLGGDGDDTVNGGGGPDNFIGGENGDDHVDSGDGNDIRTAGGLDTNPGAGRDYVTGAADNDSVQAQGDDGNSPDDVVGGGGSDRCYVDASGTGTIQERSVQNCEVTVKV